MLNFRAKDNRIKVLKAIVVLIFILYSAFVYSQTTSDWCGYDKLLGLNQRLKKTTDSAHLEAIGHLNRLTKMSFNNKIYQIPVVFHILYYDEKENIADSVIISQLEILNKAFFGIDSLKIRKEFRAVIGNAKIQFVLAKIDPNGNKSTGINRVRTWRNTFENGDSLLIAENMKFKIKGGTDAWNTDMYLNIWICNLNSIKSGNAPIFGYAYPPVNAKYWDKVYYKQKNLQGIVIHYQVIGVNNPEKLKGSNTGVNTLVHEIGHYLGLKHIWVENSNCTEDDFLWDTPQASIPTRYCDYNKNTCSKVKLSDLPDMIENFMDYSPEKCLQMFTTEQVLLMQYNLMVNRNLLFNYMVTDKPEQNKENNLIWTYPNPAHKYIYLEKCLHDNKNNPIMQGQIIDILGNSIYSFNLNDIVNKLDIEKLSPGFYLIYIKFNDVYEFKRFIKSTI
jgi:hypothetical protein